MRSLILLLIVGCAAPARGLRATPEGDGPVVLVDWDAEPLPDLPYPNDLSTVVDITSPTGLRLNIPALAETEFETEARAKINRLTGFGVYAPITVSFEAPLDLDNILQRHPNDLHLPTTFDDDAVYLINVDPDSEAYGEFVHLDVGHGRFPADVFQTDRYFPNDTRSETPSIIFDTFNEDLDGDGELDWGEDVDNDGMLDDKPNIWPPDGDPFEDLLTFYDRGSDQLIVRPVVPLRENTTYAVVLTERLVGEDGEPVRSPWAAVNHTRQSHALGPLHDLLPEVGLSAEDVGFAWTFTTGEPTRDLLDIRSALDDGEGPYAFLQELYPPVLHEIYPLHSLEGLDPYVLPIDRITDILFTLELTGTEESSEVLAEWFESNTANLIAGSAVVPYLLVDSDIDVTVDPDSPSDWSFDGHYFDADESFDMDPFEGRVRHAPQRLPFTCTTPKENGQFQQPYPVAWYGHGYGSNRLEVLLFGAALNRFGVAVCGFDFPGHGVDLAGEELDLVLGLLEGAGMSETIRHVLDGRQRDLDNDGTADSGGDQWTADPFHTRDMVRQASVDWIQLNRVLRSCGSGMVAETVYNGDELVRNGNERMSCDWDNDGVPDIGGPDGDIHIFGGSLGGINVGVAAGVLKDVQTFIPVVPAGGIVDVGTRTLIGGAVEAFVGRLVSPIILGLPEEDGRVRVVQMVNRVTSMDTLTIGWLDDVPAGGKVVITNLDKGIVREGYVPDDGRFRVSIAADAMNAAEKAEAAGIPVTGPEPDGRYEIAGNDGLGDAFVIEFYDTADNLVRTFDSWEVEVVHEGITMPEGSPLVAGNEGNGRIRGSADARRLAYISALVLEPGDPIAYAPSYHLRPVPELGPRNVFVVPTAGDALVPVNTGIALARASGMYDWQTVDDRYGMTIDQWLIDRRVIQGIEERGPWVDVNGNPALFDMDDLDDGTDDYGAPSDAPLRANVSTEVGVSGLRLPYVEPTGTHGFGEPRPSLGFDIHTYGLHMLGNYVLKRGQVIEDRPCFEDVSCPDFPGVSP